MSSGLEGLRPVAVVAILDVDDPAAAAGGEEGAEGGDGGGGLFRPVGAHPVLAVPLLAFSLRDFFCLGCISPAATRILLSLALIISRVIPRPGAAALMVSTFFCIHWCGRRLL